MNPKGLVFAASTTSQMLTPMRSETCSSSFIMAMFTQRKMFSSSLVISAARVEVTGTTVSMQCEYIATAARRQAGVTPPTTLGVLRVWYTGLPGSTRSGLKARNRSVPTLRPPDSRIGSRTSSVVPG
jgi:hypothetical protein